MKTGPTNKLKLAIDATAIRHSRSSPNLTDSKNYSNFLKSQNSRFPTEYLFKNIYKDPVQTLDHRIHNTEIISVILQSTNLGIGRKVN